LPKAHKFPRLYAVVDVQVSGARGWEPRELARAFVAGGARLLQLRAKDLGGAAFLDLATAIVEDARAVGAQVIVNDRADIAQLAGAAGVHVGQDDLSVVDARRIVGADAIVGVSTHTREQVAVALAQPVSYIAIGPVYGTHTKETGYEPVGLDIVTAIAATADANHIPVVAIGGITLETAPSVIDAGAASVAVITDLLQGDPSSRVRAYVDRLSG
jgi:thiamine-phosphate pyrophosphorylase